ncbi:50S ribosomal protein L25/general stress protein Ctc [Ruania halotolerans]|uniref:50S ribosomal protein L25/general stress protein Ctc n=1 Tax=Ruania halotolerans TaxID=2897773 RepID=UPI001E53FCDF|nr:50S ribosomal protein L25/general stress protein Ctc [Ruania halotolerans]UFU07406.1 50S ribosomal protein L25/general stress protein Ctc [Ruania halotolerans]
MATNENRLTATTRTEFGKGAARRTRRDGLVPAVLYGHGTDPVHLALPTHDTWLVLKDNPNALLTLDIDGSSELALARDIQRDPVKWTLEHIDLILVRKGEKVVVDVSVHVLGESAPQTSHTLELASVSLEAEATHLPEYIEVSIEGLEDGEIIRAGELTLPEGSTLETDPETPVVVIYTPRAEPTEDEESEETEGAEASGGGESSDSASSEES